MKHKLLLPALAALWFLPGCMGYCHQCYVIGDGPFISDNDTVNRRYNMWIPFGVEKNKEDCQELADSLNRDDSGLFKSGIFDYRYHCTCEMIKQD